MKDYLRREIPLGKGVQASLVQNILFLKGPKGEAKREFVHPKVKISIEGDKIILQSPKATKREKTIMGSFQSHIRNLVQGVVEPHLYTLKICSGHFPMSVAVSGNEFVLKNFLGESVARKVKVIPGATIKITGTDITVSSPDVEVAGQMAACIEQLCRITNRDLRIFQDGIYITMKAGQEI